MVSYVKYFNVNEIVSVLMDNIINVWNVNIGEFMCVFKGYVNE